MDNTVLSYIKTALSKSDISPVSYDVTDARLIDADLSTDQKVELFQSRAQASGSNVHIVCCKSSLKEKLAELIDEESTVMSSMTDETISAIADPKDLMPENCYFIGNQSLQEEKLFHTDIAVTDVCTAIAETGSIAVCPSPTQRRMKSLVCQKHIALIRSEQICSDLLDFSAKLKDKKLEELPGGFNLVSGPSKTADIELQLVIGVHGPAELHLIIIK